MANPRARRQARRRTAGHTVAIFAALAVAVAACSSNGPPPASSPTTTAAPAGVTVMVEGHSHTIATGVRCTTSAANTTATPAESGTQTTQITAKDDAASVSLSVSDETPPSVNGFALSVKSDSGEYQMPYQAVQSPSQVQATRQGKSYTVSGTGDAAAPGQSAPRRLQFGIHATCP